jgi:diacylglycerol O-acyltransferase / wax synthase
MANAHYERLSALDAHFLDLEDEAVHMHVAVVLCFDAAALSLADGRLDVERIRSLLASRLHEIPRYRQRLARTPLEHHPVWVDDPSFKIEYHVRHVGLPRPGDERQLKRLVGLLMSQKFDPGKPLWEMWVIEGLEGGRFAILARCHHCMVDGIAGVGILRVLLRPEADDTFPPGPSWRPRPAPGPLRLVGGAFARRVREPLELASATRRALGHPGRALRGAWDATLGVGESFAALRPASPTPLNPPHIGPHRRVDWLRFDLGAVKEAKGRLGGTLNDLVLAAVAGAMRSYLRSQRVALRGLDFRVMCPVSVRPSDAGAALGNRVVMLVAPLPVAERDPLRRLRRVIETTRELKASRAPRGSELIEELADWTSTSLVTQTMRLATRLRVFNLIVTNVPGPRVPLFLLGAPLLASYPLVPLYENQAAGIALLSYDDGLFWGLTSDWDRIPELHDIALALDDAFQELRQAAPSRATPARRARPSRRA